MLKGRDRVLAWALPVVLIVVALNQVVWAHTRDLTPWKGGGFGMFASVDLLSYRPLQAEFITHHGTYPIDIHNFRDSSDRARKVYTNARGLPDDRRMSQLVEVMFEATWTVTDGIAEFAAWPDDPVDEATLAITDDGSTAQILGVELDIFRVTYQRGDEFVVPELIRSFHYDVDGRTVDLEPAR